MRKFSFLLSGVAVCSAMALYGRRVCGSCRKALRGNVCDYFKLSDDTLALKLSDLI